MQITINDNLWNLIISNIDKRASPFDKTQIYSLLNNATYCTIIPTEAGTAVEELPVMPGPVWGLNPPVSPVRPATSVAAPTTTTVSPA